MSFCANYSRAGVVTFSTYSTSLTLNRLLMNTQTPPKIADFFILNLQTPIINFNGLQTSLTIR